MLNLSIFKTNLLGRNIHFNYKLIYNPNQYENIIVVCFLLMAMILLNKIRNYHKFKFIDSYSLKPSISSCFTLFTLGKWRKEVIDKINGVKTIISD